MSNQDGCTRRALLPGAAAMIVPRHVLGGQGRQAPSDTLNIAGVGVGGMGRRYLQNCESERIVALCDVDHGFAANVFRRYPKAKVYRDFREMLDKEKAIDAVVIATPDHNHAIVQMAALRMGKHVYSAKPLTRTLYELRAVANAAREAKVATQMSVQTCASDEAQSVAEILLSGAIGPVSEVHVWCDHPLYPAGQQRPTTNPPAPEALDWDRWIGPAPYRAFHPLYHPWLWRSWWDFGTGTVGDMTCHALHVFYEALELGAPVSVHGSRTKMHGGLFHMSPDGRETLPPLIETPDCESYSTMVAWDFPARGERPPVRVHWYDGGLRPPRPLELDPRTPLPSSGLLFVGSKGKMLAGYSGGKVRLLPETQYRDFQPPPKTLPRAAGHYREWIQAAKGGKPASCNFELGSRLTEVALLGTLAARAARYLEWDSANLRITNDADANQWVNPPYRKGWSL
ncbi:MAG TPA: Gfo/Idh/MocA family oxidoreductase [Bryobacteraceae bacterium]|jgi:predicted dehydrogenase|nr:Gfo/Idh/MocA family oxidoreductase [Bryobacteraceae bacterium]